MKSRVLWVEDDARFGLTRLAGPVYVHGGYDLVVADDVSTAIELVSRERFDAVIVDIRLPPGDDPRWRRLYAEAGYDKIYARLGLHLLRSLLGHPEAHLRLEPYQKWLTPDAIGVFTVESQREIGEELKSLGIHVYRRKKADVPDTILPQIIKQILDQQD